MNNYRLCADSTFMEDLLLQVKEVLMEVHLRFFSSKFMLQIKSHVLVILYYLFEICFVDGDSHSMLFFCVNPHPLQWQNFSTKLASSLTNVCQAVAEPELDLCTTSVLLLHVLFHRALHFHLLLANITTP